VLVNFLRAKADIFAWSPSDMPGIPREVAEHSLDILPHARAVQQRLRRFDEERRRAIGAELRKLLEAGLIKEVFQPTWLANPVLVKKKNGKWRMCIDYSSLNKACPKVPFPLPRIDQIIDSTAGCELLCFLDAYSGYHQIKMKESDQLAIRSSRRSGCSVTSRCRSASETQVQHINAACSTFSEITSGERSRRTLTTSS
jgi:DNA-binding transcriptional ArsR family regulator